MPSIQLTPTSGGQVINLTTNWSGTGSPKNYVELTRTLSGSLPVYVGLSGGTTLNSGGLLDGTPFEPGQRIEIPRAGLNANLSGEQRIFLQSVAAQSGERVYYEVY